jgi:hypothetical protein
MFLLGAFSIATSSCSQTRGMRQIDAEDSQNRIALVIGNARYAAGPLRNPENDARAVSKALQETGFQVFTYTNLNQKELKKAIRTFGDALSSGGVALFYYSGHGVQVKGSNYLIPVNADIRNEGDVELEAVDANYVLNEMEVAKSRVNIVVLDACRDNPLPRSVRSASRGLAQMNAPMGTIIAFSTSPGSVASDGTGEYGLYTQEFVKNVKTPGLPVETVFKRTLSGVKQQSRGNQIPWTSYSIEGDFYFVPSNTISENQSVSPREESKENVLGSKNGDRNQSPETLAPVRDRLPVYLSDLKELAVYNIMSGVGRDSGYWGGPLQLDGVVYKKGIVTHPDDSPGYVDYTLDERYSYFKATIAMMDDCSLANDPNNGNAVFTVQLDGREVFRSPMLQWNQRNKMEVDIPVRGAQVMRLGISNGNGRKWSDHAAWINARFE